MQDLDVIHGDVIKIDPLKVALVFVVVYSSLEKYVSLLEGTVQR
jgi:hypothetical protein